VITLLKSKLWSSNPFSSANVTNKDRRQIAGKSRQKLRVLTAKTPRLLDGSSPNLDMMYPDYRHCTRWKRIYDRPIRCRMPKQRVKVILRDADCTTSYVLNSGVTEPNLTKFLHGVQRWLQIALLESKLRSSNPFGNANVTNEDRRQIAGGSRKKLRVLTA